MKKILLSIVVLLLCSGCAVLEFSNKIFTKEKELVENIGLPETEYGSGYTYYDGYLHVLSNIAYSYDNSTPWAIHQDEIISVEIDENVTRLNDCMFSNYKNLQTVILPSTILVLPQCVFEGCESLKEIKIPASVTCIEDYAFANSGLTSIAFPSHVEYIDNGSFDNCANLTTVTFEPGTIIRIQESAFSNCNALSSIYMYRDECRYDSDLNTLADKIFFKSGYYENGVFNFTYGNSSFADSSCLNYFNDLQKVSFQEGIDTIPEAFLSGYKNISVIELPSTLKTIEANAFSYTGITDLYIPESVEYINDFIVYGCDEIVTIRVDEKNPFFESYDSNIIVKNGTLLIAVCNPTIPQSIIEISPFAFYCHHLNEIEFPVTLKVIGKNAFAFNSLSQILIPKNVECIDAGAFSYNGNLKTVYLEDSDNPIYISETAFKSCDCFENTFIGNRVIIWTN